MTTASARYALLDSTLTIVNILEIAEDVIENLDPIKDHYEPPVGHTLVKIAAGQLAYIGKHLDDNNIVTETQDQKAVRIVDGMQRFQFEIAFDMESRMRVREGKPAITKVQYRTALINLWKTLNP